MNRIKVGLLQMTPCGNDQEANMAKGEAYCRYAKQMGADLALFPEMWNIGFVLFDQKQPGSQEEWQAQAVGRDDRFVGHFAGLAKELRMAIALTYGHEPDQHSASGAQGR